MGLEDLVGTALVVGGTIYVVDKLTGKKKKVKLPTKKIPRRKPQPKRSNIRKTAKRSPSKRKKK